MTDCPDHPVRERPEFIMLRRSERNPDRWGVKLTGPAGGTYWSRPVWTYGPTPEAALDAALVYLFTTALQEM